MQALREKQLLRRSYRGVLSDPVRLRAKQPYRAPVAGALLSRSGRQIVGDLLACDTVRDIGLFDEFKVDRLRRKLLKSDRVSEFDNMLLAGIVSTQRVYQQLGDGARRLSPASPPDLFIDRRHPQAVSAPPWPERSSA